ncbi:AIPR family protein [Actinomycetospora callitridis]|uniref:AIPR family protein n=1 Tax=Actinomycetospora callitridis TaxID=913944 RepID=UPI002365AA5F|nr:AIPR family protein [Actinomycetospora callitridis]MDD7917986.1 AIPR family protein [Actinomycetospora callitridis]
MSNSALTAFASRDDLARYGSNGLILFALQMNFGIEDIHSVAASALTDGPDDKSCDLVYVDRATSCIVLAQGYFADIPKASAKASKASDLNAAVSWLLNGKLEEMPDALRSAAMEVRQALEEDRISSVELWYVHNCPESDNATREVEQAASTAKHLIDSHYSPDSITSIVAREIGRDKLENWYRRTEVPIIVTDEFRVPVIDGFAERTDKWTSFCTSVPGAWLRQIWLEHETDLLSPNVRDYLGLVRSEKNINFGIKKSAREDASQFWIYNNGLTIVVNEIEIPEDLGLGLTELVVRGLGIVNGAQTTGTLGTLSDSEASALPDLRVMVRFVKCQDPDVLRDIVRYNNTQNKIEAADFRSNDAVQDRLRAEFDSIPEAEYRGGRRGGVRDAIERKKNLIANNGAAQALAAFHGRPNLAYNDTRLVWTDDAIYAQLFSDRTTARHIVLCHSLLRSIEEAKQEIQSTPEAGRTDMQRAAMDYFRRRGSLQVLCAAISASIESIVGFAIPDRFGVRFSDNCSPRLAAERWSSIVQACLPFAPNLKTACDRDLQNSEKVRDALAMFAQFIAATRLSNQTLFDSFADNVQYVGTPVTNSH